jgi:dihydrolipoamide dehydrogenase
MNTRKVDIAILGAGSSGMRAYREASKFTDSVVLIEGGDYGTTCASVGCMPSKLLIAAAEAAHAGQHAQAFGIHYSDKRIDGRAVMSRIKKERDRFVGFVVEDVQSWPEEHRIKGYATFLSDNRLRVDDHTEIEAKRIIIATGSRPNIIPPFKDFGDRLIINDDIFQWDDLPESVAVFGAGVIGLELGQALHRLGVRVSLFGRDNLVGPLTDPAVLAESSSIFASEFNFYPHAEVTRRDVTEDGVVIEFLDKGNTKREHFDYVLAATGRTPNLDNIGLENTSLRLNERGVPDFDLHTGQVEDSTVFIAGDVNNVSPLLHEASDEGAIAGYNTANYPNIRRFKKSSSIGVVFSDPQIMMIGQTFRELSEGAIEFEVGELNWQGQGRSRVMLMNKGLLRVYGEKNTGRFLGAEMIGPRAEHLAHLLAWAHQSNLTINEILERPFYHPVFEEGVRTAFRDLNHRLQMGEKPPARCIDCGPGS